MKIGGILSVSLALLLIPAALNGSDHADPISLDALESGLTDLFAFPDGDRMVVILAARRALTAPPPYELEPFEYAIYMDLHSKMSFDNAEQRARYGGTVENPEGIGPDVTIKIRLNNDATLNSVSYEGLQHPDRIRLVSGVFDDPFIFPRFFKKNAIAMILSIPFLSFPDKDQKDWLLWGTSTRLRDNVQIDHVGRANRTQLGRFDFLNTLPPSRHVAAIREKNSSRARIQKLLMDHIPPVGSAYQLLQSIRGYDEFPDVMIFTTRLPAGFPNGRRLTDDVALLSCEQGDCPLVEFSFIDSKQWPRAAANDKPFLAEFPYLAEPWPSKAGSPPAPSRISSVLIATVVVVAVIALAIVVVPVWLFIRWRRKKDKT